MNGRMLRRGTLVVLGVLAFACPAWAGEGTVIRKKIDEKLQNTASKLKDLDSRSGDAASEIQDAQRSVDDILGFLDELKNVQGEDSEAQQIAERWPSQAKALKESIDGYKKLKAGQDYLNPDVPGCQREVEDLKTFLTQQLSTDGRKNTNGPNEIRTKAGELQKKWQGKKDDADKMGRDLASYKEKAAAFSFRDGEWSRIVDSLQSSAGKSLTDYNVKRAQIYDSDPCRQLQLGTSARDVDQALKSLDEHGGTITARYKQLRQDFIAWRTDAVAFRSTAEQDSKDIRDAFCNDYDWEKKVEEISNRYMNDLKGKWDRLQSQQTKMLNEVDQLLNDSKDQSLPEFKQRIVRLLDSLERIKDGELKGINNPKVRAHIDYGVAEHKSRQGSCAMKETYLSSEFCSNPNPKYSGSGCKLDCVKGCVVIEIKPNNAGEIVKGGGQVDAYREALHKMYTKQKATMFTGDFSSLSSCVQSGDTLVLDARVETYAFCPSDPAQFFSLKEPVMDWTPP